MNNPVIFYHLWTVGEWDRVNKGIFTEIANSGLGNRIDKMYICVNTDIDFKEINLYGIPENKVEFIRIPDTKSEWPTLDLLYSKYIKIPNTPVLYLHCKGARFTNNDNIYGPVNSWTNGMTYFTVTKWKKCINFLNSGKSSVGIRVERIPSVHYSGNFWWINSNSIKFLADPTKQDQGFGNRHGAEFWIGRLGINNLFDLDPKRNSFGYSLVIPESKYLEIITKEICVFNENNFDIRWLSNLTQDYSIYSKGNGISNNSSVECYLTYIIENYNKLAKYTYFIKGDSIAKIPNLLILLKNNYIKFNGFGTFKTTDTNKGLPNHPGLDIEECWNRYFSSVCPSSFNFIAGSVFGVTREEILKYSKEFYQNILDTMEKKDHPKEDYCFERMWKDFFTSDVNEKLLENPSSGELLTKYPNVKIITNSEFKKDDIINQIKEFVDFKYIVYSRDDLVNTDLSIISNEENDSKISDPYVVTIADTKVFVLDVKYFLDNERKTKKIIKPLEQTINDFMI